MKREKNVKEIRDSSLYSCLWLKKKEKENVFTIFFGKHTLAMRTEAAIT